MPRRDKSQIFNPHQYSLLCSSTVRHAQPIKHDRTADFVLLAIRWVLGSAVLGLVCPGLQSQTVPEGSPGMADRASFRVPYLPEWLSFDGEGRARTEGNSAINEQITGTYVYELIRLRGGVHIVPNSHLSGYLQFHDTHALGLPLSRVQSNMRDVFDLRQGYAEASGKSVRARFGRQELRFGSERLIGISDWSNNSRTFDGATLRVGEKSWLEFLSASAVVIHPSSLDKHGAGLNFHGIYGTLQGVIPRATLQPILLFKAIRSVKGSDLVNGSELEVTGGAEIDGKFGSSWNYQVNGTLQRGRYADDHIEAGECFGKIGYKFDRAFWKPHLTGEFDYASGADPSVPRLHKTYDQQYPSNHNAFGLLDLFGFQNMVQERIHLEVTPSKPASILVQAEALQLATRHDAIYTSSGAVFSAAPSGGFSFNRIGKEGDVSARYRLPHGGLLQVGFSYFKSGALFSETRLSRSDMLGYVSITWDVFVSR